MKIYYILQLNDGGGMIEIKKISKKNMIIFFKKQFKSFNDAEKKYFEMIRNYEFENIRIVEHENGGIIRVEAQRHIEGNTFNLDIKEI